MGESRESCGIDAVICMWYNSHAYNYAQNRINQESRLFCEGGFFFLSRRNTANKKYNFNKEFKNEKE